MRGLSTRWHKTSAAGTKGAVNGLPDTESRGPGAQLGIRKIRKQYGDEVVLHGISVDVQPGEFLTLLGPSGSGKTTTLNLIAGFAEPDGGSIEIDGRDISRVKAHKRGIGVVFQHYALFPHMSVKSNVEFPLRERSVPSSRREERVREVLELVRLEGMEDRYPAKLSGGQQQRVALARALVFNPRVLLMDEPLGALDKKLREALQVEIKRIHRELGITFVYVTHDQEEALALSDRIAIFNSGSIEQIGTVQALYEEPANRFVADFIGESNIFEGPCEWGAEGLVVNADAGPLWAATGPRELDGKPSALLVRPEHLTLTSRGDDSALHRNSLAGVVVEILFLGPFRRIVVDVGEGRPLLVRDSGRSDDLAVGDPVTVSFDASDGRVLPIAATQHREHPSG